MMDHCPAIEGMITCIRIPCSKLAVNCSSGCIHIIIYASACIKFVFYPQAGSQPTVPVPLQVLKPNELFYSKILPLLKEKGMSEQTPRKDWPHQIQLRVLKELMAETPADLLAK